MSNYEGNQASIYDLVHEDKNYGLEVDYIINIANNNGINSGNVIDIGCGTGKHLKEFKDRGWSAFGVDTSLDMVKRAEELLGDDAVIRHGNIEVIKEKFDLAISMFNVVNHIHGLSLIHI